MANPLLTDAPLPAVPVDRSRARAEPAIRQLLEANRRDARRPSWQAGASGWDGHRRAARAHAPPPRERAWSPVGHLNGVMNGDDLRAAYNARLPPADRVPRPELGAERRAVRGLPARARPETARAG